MTETGIKADTGVWKSMSEAGLEEIDSLNLCNSFRILGNESFSAFKALLEKDGSTAECQSAASAIGTLTELGRRVHWENPTTSGTLLQKSGDPSRSQ